MLQTNLFGEKVKVILNKRIEANKRYRLKYSEKVREWKRKERQRHREKYRERKRRWRKNNPKKFKAQLRRYNERYPEKVRERRRKWYQKNKEKIREQKSKWYQKNRKKERERAKKWREKNKKKVNKKWREYYQKNRERENKRSRKYQKENWKKVRKKANEQRKKRWKIDLKFHLSGIVSRAVYKSLKGRKTGKHWEKLVGYTLKDLMEHLEKQFDGKMNWGNYGSYWEIDHRKPIALFKYNSPEDPEFKQCWSLENLQPLEKIENIRKSDNYPYYEIV